MFETDVQEVRSRFVSSYIMQKYGEKKSVEEWKTKGNHGNFFFVERESSTIWKSIF
jgi:hypothetical protein